MMSGKTRKGLLVFVVFVVGGGVVWYFTSRGGEKLNVVLISIDTCRADHLSCYGFERKTTPHVDELAKEGILFRHAISPLPLTLPAHCSLLTGTYPLYHGVHDNLHQRLSASHETLAEILSEHGFTTGAVVSSFILDRKFGTRQGFDIYFDQMDKVQPPRQEMELAPEQTERSAFGRRGGQASKLANQFLQEHKDEQFFLFLHYYDPHRDYDPPEPFASMFKDDPYSGEIAYVDHCIGEVVNTLKQLQLYDKTLIVVVGDHGEGLGDHEENEHGYFIYHSTVHVPFILRGPGITPGEETDEVVSLVDVFPTILNYLKIPVPEQVQGEDLIGLVKNKGDQTEPRYVYTESMIGTKYGCNPLFGLVGKRWKYIDTTRAELYDLDNDRMEANDLARSQAKRARYMQGQLQELLLTLSVGGTGDSQFELDEESIRRLESLGYVGGESIDVSFKLDQDKSDPKDVRAYHESMQQVTYLTFHQRYEEAIVVCKRMLSEWPQMSNTYYKLGIITYEKGNYAETIEHLNKYLAKLNELKAKGLNKLVLDPDKMRGVIHKFLGNSYYQLEQYEQAIEHCRISLDKKGRQFDVLNTFAAACYALDRIDESITYWSQALRLRPAWPNIHYNLASAYYRKGEVDEALVHWNGALRLKPNWDEVRVKIDKLNQEKAISKKISEYKSHLKENPDDPDIHSQLAKAYYQQGEIDHAIKHWNKAIQLEPGLADAHNDLATVYYRQKDYVPAIHHWREAIRLKPDLVKAYNNLAWLLAAIEDDTLRYPQEAVKLAERACELTEYKDAFMLDTLGVAYSNTGKFAKAIEVTQKAMDLALEAKQTKLAEDIRVRLGLYKKNEPYQE